MLENLFGINQEYVIGIIGFLAVAVSIITEIAKYVLPQSVPTKLTNFIVSIVTTLAFVSLSYGFTPQTILLSIFSSFVVAFVSMNGFDALKELVVRFSKKQ